VSSKVSSSVTRVVSLDSADTNPSLGGSGASTTLSERGRTQQLIGNPQDVGPISEPFSKVRWEDDDDRVYPQPVPATYRASRGATELEDESGDGTMSLKSAPIPGPSPFVLEGLHAAMDVAVNKLDLGDLAAHHAADDAEPEDERPLGQADREYDGEQGQEFVEGPDDGVVLVVGDDGEFVRGCHRMFSVLPVRVISCPLDMVDSRAKDLLPFVIIVPDEIYVVEQYWFNTLAVELECRLLIWERGLDIDEVVRLVDELHEEWLGNHS